MPVAHYHSSFGENGLLDVEANMRAKMAKTMPLKIAKKKEKN